jgi:hypothetical protein
MQVKVKKYNTINKDFKLIADETLDDREFNKND